MIKRLLIIAGAAFSAVLCTLNAAEFFVSPGGNDSGRGSLKAPFKTIQTGVNKLRPGDTLTILPGLYRESVKWHFDGDPAKRTTIRAQIPGTVLLHGDRAVTGFKSLPGKSNCYVLPCPQSPQGVNELDTLTMYKKDDTFLNTPHASYGVWSYDEKEKLLYIATSDGKLPEQHAITLSEKPEFGLYILPRTKIRKVRNVVIDGLCVRGFSSKGFSAHSSLWGIAIWNAEKCLIRNCVSFLNEGGITMYYADGSRIEKCRAYGNGTHKHVSAGNIVVFYSQNCVIDNCISFSSVTYGLRFYGTNHKNTISNSVSVGDSRGSIWIKPDDKSNKLFQCFTPGMVACNQSAHCVYNANDYDKNGKGGPTSLLLKKRHAVTFPEDFADPWNFDLRLQKGSQFKKGFAGTNVCFISPAGNDANEGKSVKSPWKTLKNVPEGATVYLLPGTYPGGMILTAANVTVAGRGHHAPAIIKGGRYGICVKAPGAIIKRLHFTGQSESAIALESESAVIECARFAAVKNAVTSSGSARINITHCTFGNDVENILQGDKCKGNFTHNISAVTPAQLYSFDNVSAPSPSPAVDGLPHGPYFFLYAPSQIKANHVKTLVNSASAADILWSMNSSPAGAQVTVSPAKGGKAMTFTDFSRDCSLHTVSLSGLKPDTEYTFRISARPRMKYVLSGERVRQKFDPAKLKYVTTAPMKFRTPARDRAPRTLYVSVTGNDLADGSSQTPFRTVSRAAMAAAPGDTVLVGKGTYPESVFVPVSGTAAKPITFKAAPGVEVWLDGASRRFCRAFILFGKEHLVFDGFRFKGYGTAYPNSSGIFFAANSKNIKISRCFSDSRGGGYSPAVLHARNSDGITLTQSVVIGGMSALSIVDSSDVKIVNNVFKKAAIWTLAIFCDARKKSVLFANNIVTDNTRAKTFQAPLKFSSLANLTEKNNLYFMRFPRNLRKIAEFMSPQGKLVQLTLDEFYKSAKDDGKSFFADPEIPVLSNQLCWRDAAERSAFLKKGMSHQRHNNNVENGRNPADITMFRHWNFGDFFNKKLFAERKVGLDPALFSDMVVKARPGYEKR
ncbi:MAG: right-handed parallel beta-helix repeat-containing protein [Lentisphaeria bacterium]|nr:right-handed parallel beta-helix repeat-containing protein [Lentisphaeria bacterium]